MEVSRSIGYTESFDNENEYDHYVLAYYNFEDLNSTSIDSNFLSKEYSVSAPNSCRINRENLYYPTYRIRYDHLVKKNHDHVWVRVSYYYFSNFDLVENPASLVINLPHNKYNHKYRAYTPDNKKFEVGKWNYCKFDYMTPYPYSKKDVFEFYMWFHGTQESYIDNFKIEVFEKKYP